MPVISIIVPVYNAEPYLRRCIDSILAQTFTDFECILIDDGSPDNCPIICDEYAEKDNRVVVIHQDNRGSAATRNIGLFKAQGEWVGFVDSDDWIEHDMFEKMYAKANIGNYDMVWCDYYRYHLNGSNHIKVQIEGLGKIDFIKRIFDGRLHGSVCNKLIKKSICINNNILFPSANLLEDVVFVVQYIYHTDNIGYVNNALYHYTFNPYSMVNDINGMKTRIEDTYENLSFIMSFLEGKYMIDIIVMEPELSFRINMYKISMLLTKETRDMRKLFAFHPDSHKHIFNKNSNVNIIKKTFLFLAVKKLMIYGIVDMLFPVYRFCLRLKYLKIR